jgi:hypothetical protein
VETDLSQQASVNQNEEAYVLEGDSDFHWALELFLTSEGVKSPILPAKYVIPTGHSLTLLEMMCCIMYRPESPAVFLQFIELACGVLINGILITHSYLCQTHFLLGQYCSDTTEATNIMQRSHIRFHHHFVSGL